MLRNRNRQSLQLVGNEQETNAYLDLYCGDPIKHDLKQAQKDTMKEKQGHIGTGMFSTVSTRIHHCQPSIYICSGRWFVTIVAARMSNVAESSASG